ncbi:MAG: HK97 family phage prohead protease [Pseudolabrys sp.]|nr:HK97 family phage prohead protease [Pseudolabrys sp.]MDP2298049.1 HK97 family phage prohead protease [Pseudolabrys sp.]
MRRLDQSFVRFDFDTFAHAHQKPPAHANNGKDWRTWLILGGRGAGKTRAGAQWVRGVALADPKARIALVGETEHEVRSVMIEGVSGLLAVHRCRERPRWIPTRQRLEWKNGAVAEVFTAENYEGLRGPQFSAAWCDELAKWRQARDRVMAGAFAATLRQRPVRRVPMLFQHDPAEPVGVWLELREDHRGLYARGRLIPEVARGRELLSLLREGAIDGLSIGFRTVRGRIDPKTRVRSLLAVDLWEISIVTFPLLAGARVRAVKAANSPPKPSSLRMRAEQDWRAVMGGAAATPSSPRQTCHHPARRR